MTDNERLAIVIRENNALRKNNRGLTKDNEVLRAENKRLRESAATAQAMAAHWKIQATGKALEED